MQRILTGLYSQYTGRTFDAHHRGKAVCFKEALSDSFRITIPGSSKCEGFGWGIDREGLRSFPAEPTII